jgi:hypothetical protein
VDVREVIRWALCAALVVAAAPGCRSRSREGTPPPRKTEKPAKPPPRLGDLGLSYVAPPEVSAALPEAEVKAMIRERLLATGVFGTSGDDAYNGEALVVCVLREASDASTPSLRAAIDIRLDAALAPKLTAKIAAEKPVAKLPQGDARKGALRQFVSRALADAAKLIGIQARLERIPELIESARSPEREVRDEAVQILGTRRAKEAVPVLLEALSDRDEEVAQHALGALVSVGDGRAVPKIIELTRHRGGLRLVQLLYALGSLGGREAEAFLWSMAQGHPDRHAQRVAAEALETLRRKRRRGE